MITQCANTNLSFAKVSLFGFASLLIVRLVLIRASYPLRVVRNEVQKHGGHGMQLWQP